MNTLRWAIVRDGVVIDVVLWDNEKDPDWAYPAEHDEVVQDKHERIIVGDMYNAAEAMFYRPLSKLILSPE